MASLIVAAGILTHGKIKGKIDAKKAKKAKGYQDRYDELEKEHQKSQSQYLQKRSTNTSLDEAASKPQSGVERRMSSESQRSTHHDPDDNPNKWVEDALKDRDKIRM
jgi:hypothetical protein